MSDDRATVRCPLCSRTFPAGDGCAVSCPMAGSCRTLCCPHCHYRFVEESAVVAWISRLFRRKTS